MPACCPAACVLCAHRHCCVQHGSAASGRCGCSSCSSRPDAHKAQAPVAHACACVQHAPERAGPQVRIKPVCRGVGVVAAGGAPRRNGSCSARAGTRARKPLHAQAGKGSVACARAERQGARGLCARAAPPQAWQPTCQRAEEPQGHQELAGRARPCLQAPQRVQSCARPGAGCQPVRSSRSGRTSRVEEAATWTLAVHTGASSASTHARSKEHAHIRAHTAAHLLDSVDALLHVAQQPPAFPPHTAPQLHIWQPASWRARVRRVRSAGPAHHADLHAAKLGQAQRLLCRVHWGGEAVGLRGRAVPGGSAWGGQRRGDLGQAVQAAGRALLHALRAG